MIAFIGTQGSLKALKDASSCTDTVAGCAVTCDEGAGFVAGDAMIKCPAKGGLPNITTACTGTHILFLWSVALYYVGAFCGIVVPLYRGTYSFLRLLEISSHITFASVRARLCSRCGNMLPRDALQCTFFVRMRKKGKKKTQRIVITKILIDKPSRGYKLSRSKIMVLKVTYLRRKPSPQLSA